MYPDPPPPAFNPSTFKIISTPRVDINEFNVSYQITPPAGITYSNTFLQWSTRSDFSSDKDSAQISTTTGQPLTYLLGGLKQASTYYARIGLTYNNQRYYSGSQQLVTDTLKIIKIGYYGTKRGINKNEETFVQTSFNLSGSAADTKIFLGNYDCPIVLDQGMSIRFKVPANVPASKYVLKLKRKGIEALSPDSIEVLRGRWEILPHPNIPTSPGGIAGLTHFGTCYNSQKGYMIGGTYWNGPPTAWPFSMYPDYIYEFDGQTQLWTKRNLMNHRFVQDPICYYYNNNIYMIGGREEQYDQWGNGHSVILKKMLRLDLGSLTWHELDNVPFPSIFLMTSFELNNEWYIGMGSDSANVSVCCSEPLPSKKFWKYNPAMNQWTQLADFPGGHQNNPTCFTVGSRAYAFYGGIPIGSPFTTVNFRQELWEYVPSTNSWVPIGLPATGGPPPQEYYQIVSLNGKAYFLTAQRRVLGPFAYDWICEVPCMEWDPSNPSVFKYTSFPSDGGNVLKGIGKSGNTFYFQSYPLGSTPTNKTYAYTVEY